jgi:multidrug efflux pump subunit AcrB
MATLIRWFIGNRVAANLLMISILVAGIAAAMTLTVRNFPEIATGTVTVTVVFPGATPAEVEEGIIIPIEDRLEGLEGIRKITSTASTGVGTVSLSLMRGAQMREVLSDVEDEVDQITVLPQAAERPRITQVDPDELAVQFAIYGDTSIQDLKRLAERVRDDLLALEGISQVEILGAPADRIDIEVRRETLQAYGLGLDDLARTISAQSLDLSGGTIDTGVARIQVRTLGEREDALSFRDLILFDGANGARVTLGNIAQVSETLEEDAIVSQIGNDQAVFVSVYRAGSEQVLSVAEIAETYLETELKPSLPSQITAELWRDEAAQLSGRIDLLAKNGIIGVALILGILMLFLDLRVAAWVAAGVVVAFVGAFIPMLLFGVTINQLSLFGFILALGIVVDDAIVVGENIYSRQQETGDAVEGAKRGVLDVYRPIIFSSITTIFAFVPLLFLPGSSGSFIAPVAAVVIFVLCLSLVESLLILPRHLSHLGQSEPRKYSPRRLTEPLRKRVDGWFQGATKGPLASGVRFAVLHPIFVVAVTLGVFVASLGLLAGGVVKFVFFPSIEGNFVSAQVELPESASEDLTQEAALILVTAAQQAARQLEQERGQDVLLGTSISIGFAISGGSNGAAGGGAANSATVEARLTDAAGREITASEFQNAWRAATAPIVGAKPLTFSASVVGIGDPIVLQVSSDDPEVNDTVIEEIRARLSERAGVFDLRDDRFSAAREIVISAKPAAQNYGVTVSDLATEVRAAFFGALVTQVQRNREEVDVRVRLPENQRNSIADLMQYRISVDGASVPLEVLADIRFQPAPSTITRIDGREIVTLTGDVEETLTTGGAETAFVMSQVVPDLQDDYPSLVVTAGGEQEEQGRFGPALAFNFLLALFAIYAALALAFGSYFRPLILFFIIPLGFVGALLGHAVLGLNLTLLSMFGVIGLAGVIVNDALLIVERIQTAERDGTDAADAISDSVVARVRAVTLTTLTTFFGIAPIILETSVQAQFLIPTAVALGFGVLFASVLQMFLVPALASIYSGVRQRVKG